MKTQQTWFTRLPVPVKTAEYFTEANLSTANRINTDIATLSEARKSLDAAMESFKQSDPISVPPEEMEAKAAKLRHRRANLLSTELGIRIRQVEFRDVVEANRKAASAKLTKDRTIALANATAALRKAGFSRLLDAAVTLTGTARNDHDFFITKVCAFHTDVIAIDKAINDARFRGADELSEHQENTRAIDKLEAELKEIRRALMPQIG